jgi:dihydrofolate reductase
MRLRVYIAMSLDGYIAPPDGSVDWLEPFFDADYGYEEFIRGIACAVMGRVTYEQVRAFGDWPYPEHDVFVLTRSGLEGLPERTVAWSESPAQLLDHLRATCADGDCWVIGGGETIREFERLGAVDDYEVFVMPVLLGDGIRLFPAPYPAGPLSLADVTAWENGAVRLLYDRASAATWPATEGGEA